MFSEVARLKFRRPFIDTSFIDPLPTPSKGIFAMQTLRLIAAAALALTAGLAAAAPSSTTASPSASHIANYVDGSEFQLAAMPFVSTRTRAEVKAEALATPRLPAYVDGSDYEQAMAMFMSNKTREMVRAEAVSQAKLQRDFPEAYGGRN
jgi:hypothetical protein